MTRHRINTKFILVFILSFYILVIGCDNTDTRVPLKINNATVYVEVADTPETRAQGLMFREQLEKDAGMLFVFENERTLSFWMKNTRIPLSIAFIDRHGIIQDIKDMSPFDERPHVSSKPVKYALEVNQHWFSNNDIDVGDNVILPQTMK